jgi:hypothetical protein
MCHRVQLVGVGSAHGGLVTSCGLVARLQPPVDRAHAVRLKREVHGSARDGRTQIGDEALAVGSEGVQEPQELCLESLLLVHTGKLYTTREHMP